MKHFFCLSALLLSGSCLGHVRADAPTPASAEAAFAAGKFDDAHKTHERLVKSDPRAAGPRSGLVRSLLRLDKWRDALREARAATLAAPADADARGLLALAEMRAGRPDAAASDSKQALSLDKDDYWGLIAAARKYLALDPKGQPFDRETPYLKNFVQNQIGFWRKFETSPAFQVVGSRPDASYTATLPIQRAGDYVTVTVGINGQTFHLLFDTGAETNFFSLVLTHDLSAHTIHDDWHEGSFTERTGIGNSSMKVDYCRTLAKVKLTFDGSDHVSNQIGLNGESVMDQQISPDSDFEIGMLLGIPILNQHSRVTIDYPHHLFTFEDPV